MGKEYLRTIAAYMIGTTPDDVLFFDRFIGALQWTAGGTAGDRVVERSTTNYFRDSEGSDTTASLRMIARTTGVTVGDTVTASINVPKKEGSILELTGAFRVLVSDELLPGVTIVFWPADGISQLKFEIQSVADTALWQYKDSAGAWQNLPTQPADIRDATWQTFKLIVDMDKNEYISFTFGSTTVDLSGIAPASVGGNVEYALIRVGGITSDTSPAEINWDDILLKEAI